MTYFLKLLMIIVASTLFLFNVTFGSSGTGSIVNKEACLTDKGHATFYIAAIEMVPDFDFKQRGHEEILRGAETATITWSGVKNITKNVDIWGCKDENCIEDQKPTNGACSIQSSGVIIEIVEGALGGDCVVKCSASVTSSTD